MISYILEILVFQLAFLLVYDLFLKKETFFQWNRAYLLLTFIASLVLPWVKLEALKTTVTSDYVGITQGFFQLDSITVGQTLEEASFWSSLAWYEWLFTSGVLVATIIFIVKLAKIQRLKAKGAKKYYQNFTKVIILKSELAFSFFKNVFLGDEIPKEKEANIIAHELVHIKQWHSLDLLFFELMRIVLWFNPLVYVYQSRMSELHEFIADAQVAKTQRKQQYQLLLSEVFQTEQISFVNQFFKSSLIKKRIVMLTKSKSKSILQLKYLLLLPLVLGMLIYTSCEVDNNKENQEERIQISDEEYQHFLKWRESQLRNENQDFYAMAEKYSQLIEEQQRLLKSNNEDHPIIINLNNQLIALQKSINASLDSATPFMFIDEPPIFPGCENASDKRACFQEKIQDHIRKHFNYPKTAQEQGIQGRVSVVFQIAEDGSITNIKKRGPHPLLEDEVERIINRLPQMQPGKHQGKTVSVPFSIPVIFKLDENLINQKEGYTVEYQVEKLDNVNQLVRFAEVDEVPIFPGCENASDKRACFQENIQKHIRKNFNYPKEAQDLGIQGLVSVVFNIAENGSITHIGTGGPHELLKNEVERIIKKLPKMRPGKQDGEPVTVPFSIPVNFVLEDGKDINTTKRTIAESMLDLLEGSTIHQVLPTRVGLNNEVEKSISDYNKLVSERNRLLASADASNPVIKALDDQLLLANLKIKEQLKIALHNK